MLNSVLKEILEATSGDDENIQIIIIVIIFNKGL